MALKEANLADLEALLQPFAVMPEGPIWLPISLYTMQGRSVAICLRPAMGGNVVVSDEGEVVSAMRDIGFDVEPGSAISRDIEIIAKRRGFKFDGNSIKRLVVPDEIPTAALHLAEAEIGASALLEARYVAPSVHAFQRQARAQLRENLRPPALKVVKFGSHYKGQYENGEFFCVAELKKPIGVKLVTNTENMKDAVIVGMLYQNEPIELLALRKPNILLGGPRVIQFSTFYAGHQFEKVEKLADYINQRAAG